MGNSIFVNTSLLRERLQRGSKWINDAGWWRNRSHDEIRDLVFSPELKRSWFVLSSGSCPSCRNSVPMYEWIMDPFAQPWKVMCPHCRELFPKNNFGAYYASGIGADGVFQRERADGSLLVAPDGGTFGVDDGNGFINAEGTRWLFVAAYLVHGHWDRLVIQGLNNLSISYALTGDVEYARRVAILLYRISQFFPDYSWRDQGVMYEQENYSDGYVGYWASTTHDLRAMAYAYDTVGSVISNDRTVAEFLGVDGAEACRSIEERIFRDALANEAKYSSNPPNTEFTTVVLKTVLGWPDNRDEVLAEIDEIVELCTKVDGLVGEKGLAGYAAIGPRELAALFLLFDNVDIGAAGSRFIDYIFDRHPILRSTYRFHIDTWYRGCHYPGIGDYGGFAEPTREYPPTMRNARPTPPFTHGFQWFTYYLSTLLDDRDFARVLYLSNGNSTDGLFEDDLLVDDPEALCKAVAAVIDETGAELRQSTTHYRQWRLALLYSGKGKNRQLFCLNYDSGANHSSHEALNIGLFAFGMNLLPTFGYPPVNHGGWHTERFQWYRKPASHNLVVIDGREHTNLPGGRFVRYPEYGSAVVNSLGGCAQFVWADAKEYAGTDRYERLCVAVGTSYVVDVFHVRGGEEHTLFLRSTQSSLQVPDLSFAPGADYGHGTFMRNFQTADPGGTPVVADFALEDIFDVADPGDPVHLRYYSQTPGVSVTTSESWVDVTRWQSGEPGARELWIPTLMLQHRGPESTFVGVLEPYRGTPAIRSVRSLEPQGLPDGVAYAASLALELQSGEIDYIVAVDPGPSVGASDAAPLSSAIGVGDSSRRTRIETTARLAVVRRPGGEEADPSQEPSDIGVWPTGGTVRVEES